jgi:integrase
VCATPRGAKNLETETQIERPSVGGTQTQQDIKGKLVEYAFYMQKQGYSEATIKLNMTALKVLTVRSADLLNPESVKDVIAKQKQWSENRKRNVITAYSLFLKINRMQWEKPKCNVTQKFPFIPNEQEIDALISGTGKKTATFLQLLKETAMRSGEAKRLEWVNIDVEKSIVTLNLPEKGSNPRMWKVSQKLIGMLNALPRDSQKVFGDGPINSMKTTFLRARKRLAAKLQNPRLLRVSFHTFRHWKATMEYHKTHDPYYVKQFLGHKSLRNTEIYINIERTLFEPESDEFTVKVTDKVEEVKTLLEVGFEYVCQKEGLIFLRKRK